MAVIDVDSLPPPGVTPAIWDSLSEKGKAQAQAKFQAEGGALSSEEQAAKDRAEAARVASLNQSPTLQQMIASDKKPALSENGGMLAKDGVRSDAAPAVDFAPPAAPAGVGGSAPHAAADPYATARWGGAGGGGGAVRVPDQELWRVGGQVRGAFGAADQQENAAVAGTAEDEAGNAVAEQGALHQIAADEQKRQAATDQREKSRAAELKSYQEQADRLAEEATSVGIDSKKMWNDMGTGRSTLAILGMALGNFSSNGNQAANLLESAWQKDIDAQKANVSLLGDRAKFAQGMFGQALNRFGDERQAEAATHQAYLAATEIKLKEMAASLKPGQAQDKARELLAALAEKRAERLSQMLQFAPAHVVGGGGGGPTEKEIRKRAQDLSDKAAEHGVNMSVGEARARAISEFSGPGSVGGLGSQGYAKPSEAKSKEGELVFNGPDGTPLLARNPISRKTLADTSASTTEINAGIQQYQQALARLDNSDKIGGHVGYTSENLQRAQTVRNELLSKIRKAQDDGVWKRSETEMLEQNLPEPHAIFAHPEAALAAAKQQNAAKWRATVQAEAPQSYGSAPAGQQSGPPPSLQPGPAPK